ncbi:interferon-induced GTP-binding protein Mx, partial [Pyrenophora tritici-repentis]
GYHKRLRAVLQNTLIDFAEDMRKKGHTHTITDGDPTTLPFHISRSDYVAKVTRLLKRSRGRELPGTFDPLIVGQLFHEQREPWAKLVDQYLEIILRAVYFLAHTALAHVCGQSTLTGLSRQFIYIRLERLTAELRNKVTELLKPHDAGHPITYNHYLTENVQKSQSKRQAREIKRFLERILGGDYTAVGVFNIPINVNMLINAVTVWAMPRPILLSSAIAMATMNSDLLITKTTVILDQPSDWQKWIFLRKDSAQRNDLWAYVNPNVATETVLKLEDEKPAKKEAGVFYGRGRTAGMVYDLEHLDEHEYRKYSAWYTSYQKELTKFEKKELALRQFNSEIATTISERRLHWIMNLDTPHARLRKLKNQLCPSTAERETQLLSQYIALRKMPKRANIESWLDSWEELLELMAAAEMAEVKGTRAQRDFLDS